MARPKKETDDLQQEETTQLPGISQEFECWNVDIKVTKPIDPETGEHERKVTITKKGTDPARVTIIDQKHADVLNAQVENTKQYFYPKS